MSAAASSPAPRDRLREAEERILDWAVTLLDLKRAAQLGAHVGAAISDHYSEVTRLALDYEQELYNRCARGGRQ